MNLITCCDISALFVTSHGLQQQNKKQGYTCLIKAKSIHDEVVSFLLLKGYRMAGPDVDSSPSKHSKDQRLLDTEVESDVLRVNSMNAPYQNEPLALGPQGEDDLVVEEADEEGLSFATIKARYDKVEPGAQWFVLYFYYLHSMYNLRRY